MISFEVAARFIPNRAKLRGKTIIEYRHWSQRRVVRCLGAEQLGSALMIEAVDVGPAETSPPDPNDTLGEPEDWLAIDGRAFCRVNGLRLSDQPRGHCLFHVALIDWRDLRIGESAPLACLGISLPSGQDIDNSITPLLHTARDLPASLAPPSVEIVRLRERQRIRISPLATDWSDESTLVVARIETATPLRSAHQSQAIAAY